MSTFHLHARLFEGTLAAPKVNELQSQESDDREGIERLGEVLARRGFAVWVYVHDHSNPMVSDGYAVVAEWNDRGERLR